MPKSSGQGNWVTINGVHVLIDGNKKIIQGPKNLIGMTPRQAIGLDSTDSKSSAKSEKSPVSKAMAKAKSDREVEPSKKKKADGLVNRAKGNTLSSAKAIMRELAGGQEELNAIEHGVKINGKYYQTSTGIDGRVFVETPTKSIPIEDFKKQMSKSKTKSKSVIISSKDSPSSPKAKKENNTDSLKSEIKEAKSSMKKAESMKSVSDKAVSAAIQAQNSGVIVGGGAKLETSSGETVSISVGFRGEVKATIFHKNGNTETVYADTKKTRGGYTVDTAGFAKKINAVKAQPSPNTGNSLFDNATSTNTAKSGRGKK